MRKLLHQTNKVLAFEDRIKMKTILKFEIFFNVVADFLEKKII